MSLSFRTVAVISTVLAVLSVSSVVYSQGSGTGEVIIDARVPGCGDLVIDSGEECDGSNLGGATCQSESFTSGSLTCTASCLLNTSACIYTPPSPQGSGGGGGLRNTATVVLVGKAYPRSVVTIIKGGQIIAKTIASPLANFQVSVTGLSAGNYNFMVFGEDVKGFRSPLLSFPVMVSKGTLTKIEDIYIAPTIALDKTEVRQGDVITIFGQSVPNAKVTLEVNSPQQFFRTVAADTNGTYIHNFDSSVLELGDHSTQSKSATNTEISALSARALFQVGTENVLAGDNIACSKRADLNADCRVNLVDFSIAAFWYLRPLTPAFILREAEHLSGDGKVNLVDFSIMAFHWTG